MSLIRPAVLFYFVLSAMAAFSLAPTAAADDSATPEGVSLERIMADPDWLGRQPEEAWWSWDGGSVYYLRKREGEKIRDLFRVPADGGEAVRVPEGERSRAGAPDSVRNRQDDRRLYTHDGDIFVRDLESGDLHQVTRTAARETGAFFMADGRSVAYRDGHTWYVHDPETGLTRQAAEVRAEKDPLADEEGFDYLKDQQERLFSTLRETKRREDNAKAHERDQRAADPMRTPPPFFLGDDVEIAATSLSPDGRHLLVVTQPEDYQSGEPDEMPNYVTRSGYVETEKVRTLVGKNDPAPHEAWLLDLEDHETTRLDTSSLPGIEDDPLADLRQEALDWHVERGGERDKVKDALEAPDERPLHVEAIEWTADGARAAVQLHSVDNKDRWIATLEPASGDELTLQHRLTDEAWINWSFNEFGWLPDNETLWYLSEETGYAHLYVKPVDGNARQLTEGDFEISTPTPTLDGSAFYLVANQQNPGWHDVYRVSIADGGMERVTQAGIEPEARTVGYENPDQLPFRLSPDESRILFYDGSRSRPPEVKVAGIDGNGEARRLTHTISDDFLSLPWTEPEIIQVPSSHVDRSIQARLYLPPDYDESETWPAVIFVHGAGYLQNAHYGWSSYFREFMFHTLLNLHGYVVLDMDYRASEGYGRDWRTAIYRRMGHPELEDILDGAQWLQENHNVDEDRLGIYGGSYGGFMTFMALFRAPETFAAGASLRPVTDWVHYNHAYTSNILNTPLVDPMAHELSSPIEYAQDYANRPLAIFHGMQDDNVFYKDTVRLVQRLIELKKENYYPMFYPLDPHGFEHPESWLDEYRRIFKLFEENVK